MAPAGTGARCVEAAPPRGVRLAPRQTHRDCCCSELPENIRGSKQLERVSHRRGIKQEPRQTRHADCTVEGMFEVVGSFRAEEASGRGMSPGPF